MPNCQEMSNFKYHQKITQAMSIHKITPFLSDIKTFFKNSDMTAAMQHISSILSQVRMTESDTLAVRSKRKLRLSTDDRVSYFDTFPLLRHKERMALS